MDTIITQFGSQQLAVLRMDIQAALDNIKFKYGLADLALEGIRFTTTSFTAKISGKTKNSEEDIFEKDKEKFFAMRYGLPVNPVGSEFLLEGLQYVIIRIDERKPKYPIIARCKDHGKTFKFTVERIKELLEKNRIINI